MKKHINHTYSQCIEYANALSIFELITKGILGEINDANSRQMNE